MPEIETADEQHAAQAYERWLTSVREGDGPVANTEPDVFLAGWLAGRGFQEGWQAAHSAVKAG